jgi:hypothetical protein
MRSLPDRIAAGLRTESARSLGRPELIVLASIVLVPTLLNAIALLPEITVPAPSLNDDVYHMLFIQNAAAALTDGRNLLDQWLPQVETGVPQFFYYQHLAALVVVALQRMSFNTVDLFTVFNVVRYVLMVTFPFTVFLSMRWMGFSTVAAAIAAAASSLLSANFKYGFEYDSYVWRGLGLFTQLFAMHLTFLTIAAFYQAIHLGKRLWLAGILFGLLTLTHLLYAYMAGMALVLIVIWGLSRTDIRDRLWRIVVVGGAGAIISSYQWLPLIGATAFDNVSPYLQPEKYDSYGAPQILSWLVSGDVFDHGRLPVLTILFALGVVAAVLSRSRIALLSVGLFVLWLVAWFGRPTLGALADLFPLHQALLFHRFSGGVDLAAILLMGLGGALIWGLLQPDRRWWRLGLAAVILQAALLPAYLERSDFYKVNTALLQGTYDAVANDQDGQVILATLKTLPPGRIFAGLPATYGGSPEMTVGGVKFYNLLTFNGLDGFAPPNESMSLNADFIWDFREGEYADYQLYDVRYLVVPSGHAVASFLTPILRTSRYDLYSAPTSGYAEYVGIEARVAMATQADLFQSNLAWERGAQPGAIRTYLRYDYPSRTLGSGASASPACPDGGHTDYELFEPGRLNLVVRCSADATLILKVTYHPNWKVTVDGTPVDTFMVSPSYIGISLPAGTHQVDAVYEATPIKTPLLILGLITLVALLGLRERLDAFPDPRSWRPGKRALPDAETSDGSAEKPL